ncbi:NlpC/P60 family protein [Ruminococcaceae bacterium OttesenSCG-928-A16]|nr:NlpC/P60 family protein [Clostridia bacterium OttesenSCG-928-F22]MDL2324400.1 NlpC/P60 family protein [Ruminococcaceae bacterium OttesenSCG-928-A16]
MIAEAEKHLGKRYVFGASGPANFDCSGFVSWVLDKSGVKPMSRTNAQGIYNMCSPVSPSDAKPGDLIFFTGTYSTPNAVSHIGIYVGNGMMLHCGDPIQYTSINTSYWQDHFYAFARIN